MSTVKQSRRSLLAWCAAGPVVGAALFLVTLLVYTPTLWNDFAAWDDATFLTANPRFNPPTGETVRFYWTHAGSNLYMPLTYMLWAGLGKVCYALPPHTTGMRLSPVLFHLTGILLHGAAAAAVYSILRSVLGVTSPWPAAAGALLFAVHPLQVESVVQPGNMNTPLAGALLLTACALFLRNKQPAAAVLFAAALLCKPTAVVGPVFALLLDRLIGERTWRASAWRVLPWVLLALPCAIWTQHIQQHGTGSAYPPLWKRSLLVADAIGFYLHKLVLPWPMGIDYGRTPGWVLAHPGQALLNASLAGGLGVVLVLAIRRKERVLAVGIVLAMAAVLPNSGIVPFEFQYVSNVADRYVYLAMLGVALISARLLARFPGDAARATIFVLLAACGGMTELQIATWQDGPTMFRHAIEVNPRGWVARVNLSALIAARDPDAALAEAETAVRLAPEQWLTQDNLSGLLTVRDPARAAAHARAAIALNPLHAASYNNLGCALAEQHDAAGAMRAFERAHALAPGDPLIEQNLLQQRARVRPAAKP